MPVKRPNALKEFFTNPRYRKEARRLYFDKRSLFDLSNNISIVSSLGFSFLVFLKILPEGSELLSLLVAAIIAALVRAVLIGDTIWKRNTATEKRNSKIYVLDKNVFEVRYDKPMRCPPSIAMISPREVRWDIRKLSNEHFEVAFLASSQTITINEFKFFAVAMP